MCFLLTGAVPLVLNGTGARFRARRLPELRRAPKALRNLLGYMLQEDPEQRSSRHFGSSTKASAKSRHKKLHGQQGIDTARATEIQQALIREHYMTGEPTGQWDSTTMSAMQKYQSDQGWQTRLIPDSRALKKLGLGPDYSGAINAEGASFAPPPPVNTIPPTQAAGFAAAAGVNR